MVGVVTLRVVVHVSIKTCDLLYVFCLYIDLRSRSSVLELFQEHNFLFFSSTERYQSIEGK